MANSKIIYGGETLIDLTGDSVTPETLLEGETAHAANGERIVGRAVIPTKVSQLENDSGYLSRQELQNEMFSFNFTSVSYIASSGNQYINTGITGNQNIGFEIDFRTNDENSGNSGEYGCIMGARKSSLDNDFQLTTYTTDGDGTLRFGAKAYDGKITVKKRVQHSLMNRVYTVGSSSTTLSSTSFTTPVPITLFALNNNGSITQYGKCRIYKLKLYSGTVLVRDFIAVRHNFTGEYGLYDKVNHKFYRNEGTGSFTGP